MSSFFAGQSVGLGRGNNEILEVMSCPVIGGDCRLIIASKSVACNLWVGKLACTIHLTYAW
jgi:hypothetical protein